ncbi:unnamed protein product [Rhizophagus irregularis]|nr:unnamed protein product [Rhizophagus irregularis]
MILPFLLSIALHFEKLQLESKEKKLRAFSLYKSLKEVLAKHGIGGNGIGTIRQFPPKTYPLKDDDEELQQCVKEIKLVGEESTGRVDYAIKALEKLICITEGKLHQVTMGFAQNLVQCESALQVNKKNRKRKSGEAFGKTSTISTASLQQAQSGILSFSPQMVRYQARARIP